MRRQKIGGIRRKRSRGNRCEIRNVGMWDGNEVETRDAREIGTEACILVAAEVEQTADAGLAQVGVNEHGLIAELGESDGQVCSSGGLAFAGQSAGYENDLRRAPGLREQERSAQRPESF